MVASLLLRTGKAAAKPTCCPTTLVAATPVQDLRFRAKVLLKDAKSAAGWLRKTGMAARPGELRQAAIHSPAERRVVAEWQL